MPLGKNVLAGCTTDHIICTLIQKQWQISYRYKISFLGLPKEDTPDKWSGCDSTDRDVYDFKVKNLDGDLVGLDKYKGQVLLIVNVATYCGRHFLAD